MATSGQTQRKTLDISKESATVWFPVGDATSVRVEARRRSAEWTVGTLQLYQSSTPSGGVAISGVTIAAGGGAVAVQSVSYPWIGVRVTSTVEAASEIVDVFCFTSRDA